MNVFVITGSPHRHGCSNYLAEQAIDGARAAGHTVDRVDAAFVDVHPCIGCNHCESGKNPCIYDDAIRTFTKK